MVLTTLALQPSAALQPAQGDIIKNFRFASGETLPELRIHYRLRRAKPPRRR